jgi:cation-transporting P-type ATPase E
MGSGSQASRSVARVDGTFAAIPPMLAEGRRVVANIERVARLFVAKTVYAAIIAVVVGAAGITYPFFPRHLTIISTLTIGVPGFLPGPGPRRAPGQARLHPAGARVHGPGRTATAAAALAACVVPLLAVPAAGRILALQLPPAPVLAAYGGVVLAAVAALTLWRRIRLR